MSEIIEETNQPLRKSSRKSKQTEYLLTSFIYNKSLLILIYRYIHFIEQIIEYLF